MRAAILALGVLVTSCVVYARPQPAANTPPPRPPSEAPLVCNPGYAHVPGEWTWNGYGWIWISQRCVYHPGHRWQRGGWYPCGDGWCYREGFWIVIGGGVLVSP
jgi:hypothetical protein